MPVISVIEHTSIARYYKCASTQPITTNLAHIPATSTEAACDIIYVQLVLSRHLIVFVRQTVFTIDPLHLWVKPRLYACLEHDPVSDS